MEFLGWIHLCLVAWTLSFSFRLKRKKMDTDQSVMLALLVQFINTVSGSLEQNTETGFGGRRQNSMMEHIFYIQKAPGHLVGISCKGWERSGESLAAHTLFLSQDSCITGEVETWGWAIHHITPCACEDTPPLCMHSSGAESLSIWSHTAARVHGRAHFTVLLHTNR